MKNKPKIIMAFGTFDLIHKGHLSYLKQAKRLGDILVVSVARDVNVEKIKGKKPTFNERQRKDHLESLNIADRVVLGDKINYMRHIAKLNPDIIALGYDQKAYTENLKQDLKKAELPTKVVRLKPYKTNIYKSSKLKRKPL